MRRGRQDVLQALDYLHAKSLATYCALGACLQIPRAYRHAAASRLTTHIYAGHDNAPWFM